MKCTMASIYAVTAKTIEEALQYPPTREIVDACSREGLEVAIAMGYDLNENYLAGARSSTFKRSASIVSFPEGGSRLQKRTETLMNNL